MVLFDIGRNHVVYGDIFSRLSHIPRFAVARVLSRGMWGMRGMRGMFLAGISIGILDCAAGSSGSAPWQPSGQLLGCGLDVAVEEVDLRSQHVGEGCSAFVDVVVAAGAAEQFGPRCLAGDFERGRDGRDTVCLGNDEQEGDTDGGGASFRPTPGEAEQRPCC